MHNTELRDRRFAGHSRLDFGFKLVNHCQGLSRSVAIDPLRGRLNMHVFQLIEGTCVNDTYSRP